MSGILVSFWALIALMGVGYLLARFGVTRPGADKALTSLAFAGLMPALLFQTMANSDPAEVFSQGALANVLGAAILGVVFILIARYVLGMRGGEVTIGALCSCYTNAGNLGVAFLMAVTGDASAAAPIFLFQLCVLVPISFAVLDYQSGRPGMTWMRTLLGPFTNPPVLGVIFGLIVALAGWNLPDVITKPVGMLSDAAIPVVLIAMGISWRGAQVPALKRESIPLFLAVTLRCLGGPAITFALGSLFGLTESALLAATVAGAFPTANNVFVYAHRFNTGVTLARDAVLISTFVSLAVILIITALFHI
ncbi:AEC family transporter [Changpingibacter yushuensis]|uniref:AEC family transporter n=1 Tax=Changpingibacter yushuensis TaxID=2758440 RepID=UPI0015F785A2|nr:AEC family transporter [Changpingibacter yushuensis]